MARHFLTLYSVRYAVDGTDRPLGALTDNGQSLVDFVEGTFSAAPAVRDPDNERVLQYDSRSDHPGTAVTTFAFRFGEYGTEFAVTPADDLEAVNYSATADESRTVHLMAALVTRRNRRQGWLVTHSIGRNLSMASTLRRILTERASNTLSGTLHIDPAHLAEAWDLMLREGEVSGLVFHLPPPRTNDEALLPEIALENAGRIMLVVKPKWGMRFTRAEAVTIQDLVRGDNLVVFRSDGREVRADSATIDMDFRGSTRKLDVEASETPVKIPRLQTNTPAPGDDSRHEWMRGETESFLEIVGQAGD